MTVGVTGRGPDGMVRRSLLPEDERGRVRGKWVDGMGEVNVERLESMERKVGLLGEAVQRLFKVVDRPDDRLTRIEELLGELREAIECRNEGEAASTDPKESGDGSAKPSTGRGGRSSGRKTEAPSSTDSGTAS